MEYLKLYETWATAEKSICDILDGLSPPLYRGWEYYKEGGCYSWRKDGAMLILYMWPFYSSYVTVMTQFFQGNWSYNREELNIESMINDFNSNEFIKWYIETSHHRIDLVEKTLLLPHAILLIKPENIRNIPIGNRILSHLEISQELDYTNIFRQNFYFSNTVIPDSIFDMKMEDIAKIYDALVEEYPEIQGMELGFIGN